MAILAKYKEEGCPQPVVTNQKTSAYLKELDELVGLDEPTSMTTRRGGERLVDTRPKYEYLTMHTARRTFITLSLEGGMRAEVVMKVSGHTNYQTFKKYIKITDTVKELEMERVWGKAEEEAELHPQLREQGAVRHVNDRCNRCLCNSTVTQHLYSSKKPSQSA